MFPAFCPNFYGGVGIKPFGKSWYPAGIFSVIFLVFSPGFYCCPDILVVSCEISFTVSLTYPAFLVLVLEPDLSQDQWSPGSLPHPGCFLCRNWLLFFSGILVLHLHVCPLIPYPYLADYYLENWGMSEANMVVLWHSLNFLTEIIFVVSTFLWVSRELMSWRRETLNTGWKNLP